MGISNSGQTTLPVRWLRVPAACRYSGLSRSLLYRLIGEGKIKSVALRDRNKLRGIRLIAAESIDRFLESLPGDVESIPASRAAARKGAPATAPTQPQINSKADFELDELGNNA
jgi:hypothetical protein